jgi:hypothetical protein
MRSRFIDDTLPQTLGVSEAGLLKLPSRALQHSAGSVTDVQLCRTLAAQPNYYPRRVYPVKGGNLCGHFQSFGALQPLQ